MGTIGFILAYGLALYVVGLFLVWIVQSAWRHFVKRDPSKPTRPYGSDTGSTPGYE